MITIRQDALAASFEEEGAELVSLQKNGTEYLWNGDPVYWDRHAPILFPFVGRLERKKYFLRGREYPMGLHGFASRSRFSVRRESDSEVTFSLSDTEETRRCYPFQFRLEVHYVLQADGLCVTFLVQNLSESEMYFGIGGHPGFRVPLEAGLRLEDYSLVWDEPGEPERILFSERCLTTGREEFKFPGKIGTLPLRRNLFDHDAIVLTGTGKRVRLCSESGTRAVEVIFPDMPYIGFWQPAFKDAPFLCSEPWATLPGRDGVEEHLETFPGMIGLAPGKAYRNTWGIRLL